VCVSVGVCACVYNTTDPITQHAHLLAVCGRAASRGSLSHNAFPCAAPTHHTLHTTDPITHKTLTCLQGRGQVASRGRALGLWGLLCCLLLHLQLCLLLLLLLPQLLDLLHLLLLSQD